MELRVTLLASFSFRKWGDWCAENLHLKQSTYAQSSLSRMCKGRNPFKWCILFENILTLHMIDVTKHCHPLAESLGQLQPLNSLTWSSNISFTYWRMVIRPPWNIYSSLWVFVIIVPQIIQRSYQNGIFQAYWKANSMFFTFSRSKYVKNQ